MKKVLLLRSESPIKIKGGLGFFYRAIEPLLRSDPNIDMKILNVHTEELNTCPVADFNYFLKGDLLSPGVNYDALALKAAWDLRRALQPVMEKFKPDVLSVDSAFGAVVFSGEMNILQYTQHSSYIGLCSPANHTLEGITEYTHQKFAVNSAKAVVVHSDWSSQMLRSHLWCERNDIINFPIGLNFNDYPSNKIKHAQGKLVVSFFGRANDHSKNFELFYNTFNSLSRSQKEKVEFRVYGRALKIDIELMSKAGIRYMSFVDGPEKIRAYAETDIVIMPSKLESFGIVGLEALLSNCALIAPKGLGMDAYMPETCAVELSVHALISRLDKFISEPETLRVLQESSAFRKTVAKKEYSASQMAANYIKVWESM